MQNARSAQLILSWFCSTNFR